MFDANEVILYTIVYLVLLYFLVHGGGNKLINCIVSSGQNYFSLLCSIVFLFSPTQLCMQYRQFQSRLNIVSSVSMVLGF